MTTLSGLHSAVFDSKTKNCSAGVETFLHLKKREKQRKG